MTDAKTVQTMIRPITIECGAAGCSAKSEAAASFRGDGGEYDVIAPRGWTFAERLAQPMGDVVIGRCPEHSKK
jgi:hypothetical protein